MLIAHEPQVHYPPHDVRGPADRRTFTLTEQQLELVLRGGGGITADCSELATEVSRMAGLADPNGLGYRYAGYTGTMLSHLPHYTDPKAANIGALVVFGPGTGDHVCQVIEADHEHGNPLLGSHGGERGPLEIRLHDEAAFHRPPVTLLSIAHL